MQECDLQIIWSKNTSGQKQTEARINYISDEWRMFGNYTQISLRDIRKYI